MEKILSLMTVAPAMATDDYVGFTFFVGCMAMMAASAFFFLSMNSFDSKWKTSILVSGLITFIAAVHYWYMRDYWATNATSPTFFRYVDWVLTVPLMCVEFYLILAKAGATKKLMWQLIGLSTVMLVAGYIGETGDSPVLYGTISGIAYFVMVGMLWLGSPKALAEKAGGSVLEAYNALCWFILVGWSIYPIGYMIGTDGWYDFVDAIPLDMDVVYNIGDAINKIGFGLVIYNLAVSK